MGRIVRILAIALVVTFVGPLAGVARAAAAPAGDTPAASAPQRAPVDVNRAGIEELTSIRGIGPQLARRIVEYRKEHGRFESIDDLLAVKGIGPKLLARIRNQVTVSGVRARR